MAATTLSTPSATATTQSPPSISIDSSYTLFTRGDDNAQQLSLGYTFSYFGQNYQSLFADTNGFLLFKSSTQCCTGVPPPINSVTINALNYDLRTSNGAGTSGIWYKTPSANDLTSIKSDISRLNSSFVPTNGFQIAWNNVPSLTGGLTATFLISLASDSSSDYVVLKYYNCLNGATLRSTPSLNYQDLSGVSKTWQITNPCTSSNVNLAGTWVFLVTSIGKVTLFLFNLIYMKDI